jgi:hypothetical protein
MLRQAESLPQQKGTDTLGSDFGWRLESALRAADHERRRRTFMRRVRSLLLVLLLAAPILGWQLTLAFPDGFHVTITALAWLAFILDVGVHLDRSFLSYLGLQAMPAIVGLLLLAMVTAWLLGTPGGEP